MILCHECDSGLSILGVKQPFCATQFSSYKATGSTVAVHVTENSVGNEFPLALGP